MDMTGKTALVVGGSKGLGLGVAQALVQQGAQTTVLSRGPLPQDAPVLLKHVQGDAADRSLADATISRLSPDIIIVTAGAPPHMQPIDSVSWEDFSNTWNADVRLSLAWIQAALNAPLKSGSQVLLLSSGAAINGSPFSGGYGGAKRMIWLMADYAQKWSERQKLGITFQTIVPRQMFANTGVGEAGSTAYAKDQNISPEQFLSRFGKSLTPLEFGRLVARVVTDDTLRSHRAFSISGDKGLIAVELTAS
jgi:NAD(P)-dependent dehydrogenase (short-subunit alcohol dehydrogenase family)